MSNPSLQTQLQPVRRRWWTLGIAAGLIWMLAVALLCLLLGGWLDLVWELSPEGRLGFLVAAALLGLVAFAVLLTRVAKNGRLPLLARRVDRAMDFGGAVLTGCELEEKTPASSPISTALARMAVQHAAKLAGTTRPEKAVPAQPAQRSALFLAAILCVIGLLVLTMPDLMRTQWNRFLAPYSDVPRYSTTTIEIVDPDKKVVYGDALDIRAVVRGEPVDSAELVLEDKAGNIETLPMFPEQTQEEGEASWRANLAKVTEDAVYYVRAYRARSTKHSIEVITVPRIDKVRFRIEPPEYTGRPAYEGALPKEGVSGLPGTRVVVRASSNRPLSRGELAVSVRNAGTPNSEPASVEIFAMNPLSPGSSEVVGEFSVTGGGKFDLKLFDEKGQESRDKFSGGVTLLKDERPLIRIVRPPARSLATPSVVLPIILAAEDDYGLSSIRIFRSLNDSRYLPAELPLPETTLRRFSGQVELPLPLYGLNPGDTIRIFARAEDNDPAGAKGAESSVIHVEIISQQQFEEMVRQRDGMEAMLSRYREALRRLEALGEEARQLREELDKLAPDDPASEEIRNELDRLARRMEKEAEAIRKLADNPLPYDLDKQLSEELEKAAKLAEDAAGSVSDMAAKPGLSNKEAKEQLEKIAEKLAAGKKGFDQATMPSLELLAAVLPLKQDENRFMQIVAAQKDLADRLSSLKDRDRDDDPTLRARMRELEDEQRQLREALDSLLKGIEEHAKTLPELEELETLREDALKFAAAVRASRAEAAMAEAQGGLAEFSGSLGHARAQEAAEILESFLGQCQGGMGQCASKALRFRPGLGDCMNATMDQLLKEMGFGSGGSGMGQGGSGFGAQRGGGNVGLYGSLPGMASLYDSRGGGRGDRNRRGTGGSGDTGLSDTAEGYETTAEGTVGGATEGAVPLRYRQAVGRYFQRILEETEENDDE